MMIRGEAVWREVGDGVVFSAAPEYFAAAQQELSDEFGRDAAIRRLGPDSGYLEGTVAISDVASACRSRPLVFVRHLFASVRGLEPEATHDAVVAAVLEALAAHSVQREISLQVWASAPSGTGLRPDVLRGAIAESLRTAGFDVSRGGRDRVVSVCLTSRAVVVGLNSRQDALSDWPGGRVGMKRSASQISRAEFKLEEALQVLDVSLPDAGYALDLGASPGGWTRLLRARGLTVYAVDPAPLHPRIEEDPQVVHVPATAGVFLGQTSRLFDLAVNDMRMTPERSCSVMLRASPHLRPSGTMIMTLKIAPRRPLPIVDRCLKMLGQEYALLHARQLYHNRNEVTVVARRLAQ